MGDGIRIRWRITRSRGCAPSTETVWKRSQTAGCALGAAPAAGTDVTVTGYAAGVGGGPASCRAPQSRKRRRFPSLRCGGLVAGTTGAPWITGSMVSGVIGGLDGGGCDERSRIRRRSTVRWPHLLARAEAGGPGDAAPAVFDDGC